MKALKEATRKEILIRPLDGGPEWDSIEWDGRSDMTAVVTERYPQAFRGGTPSFMDCMIGGKRVNVATVRYTY